MNDKIIRPVETLFGIELDMRVSDKLGEDLAKQIVESVERTQLFIQNTLPNQLRVSEKQFASLNAWTQAMYNTTDRMFVTPLNVMEFIIDREVDTIKEIDDIIEGVEQVDNEEEKS